MKEEEKIRITLTKDEILTALVEHPVYGKTMKSVQTMFPGKVVSSVVLLGRMPEIKQSTDISNISFVFTYSNTTSKDNGKDPAHTLLNAIKESVKNG